LAGILIQGITQRGNPVSRRHKGRACIQGRTGIIPRAISHRIHQHKCRERCCPKHDFIPGIGELKGGPQPEGQVGGSRTVNHLKVGQAAEGRLKRRTIFGDDE
jgi:hypothetical protein